MHNRSAVVCCFVFTVFANPALAVSTVAKLGIDFCVVGDPGNRGTNQAEAPGVTSRGAVNHAFAISRTEITVGQWFEFANAYGKYVPRTQQTKAFLGSRGIVPDSSQPSGLRLLTEYRDVPAEVGWRYTAIYCNWLTNNKAADKGAFESGAYDISTFTFANGKFLDQATHSPSAKFWIPSLDEWVKSTYYDPNRYGSGNGGYWSRPGSRNTFLTPGLPQDGGETNAAIGNGYDLPVGSYPSIISPWGLLDSSGGAKEWSEFSDDNGLRSAMGSEYGESQFVSDSLDSDGLFGAPNFSLAGIRLATEIPAPSSVFLFAGAILTRFDRRRK